jgi:2-iminobutanoate/2-iminopropanoate deaminase
MRPALLALLVASACERAPGEHPGREVLVPNERAGANYSPLVRGREPVYLSGMVGIDPATGKLVTGGVGAETTQALARIEATLAEAGLSLDDVVKCTVFLADMADYDTMNAAYREVWTGAPPARTTVQALPPMGAGVEIECIASAEATAR